MPEATSAPARLQFLANHRPGLTSGVYELTATQTLAAPGVPDGTSYSRTQRFGVFGERFSLDEEDVVSMFPPPGSLGDHSTVLPHVVLRRSTLPWERLAVPLAAGTDPLADAKRSVPWLALLVFGEDELAPPAGAPAAASSTPKVSQPANVTLKTLKAAAPGWPGVALEPAQHEDDPVTVIDVPAPLLAGVLPTGPELRFLAHVRRGTDEQGNLQGDECAVVVAARLPKSGGASVAHLVSLEGRYGQGSPVPAEFRFHGLSESATIRLVSLKSWRFSCLDTSQGFTALLAGLSSTLSVLRLPKPASATDAAAVERHLARGYVPCPHLLRGGASSVSWYHGPLVPPGATEAAPEGVFPARAADALLRYHEDTGTFDTGYAAAWELGRLLALGSERFSAALHRWRHEFARYTHAEVHLAEPHLPTTPAAVQLPELPEVVLEWLGRAALLQGVPFNYLVPDERMLPVDSMRVFTLDPAWMAALLDGAFSVGRVTTAHHANDALHLPRVQALLSRRIDGFLLRSSVVAGWPSLTVNGYQRTPSGPLILMEPGFETVNVERRIVRMERLSRDVLLCLFEGEVNTVEMHQPPEALHFAVSPSGSGYVRELRHADGREADRTVPVPLRSAPAPGRVVDVASLVQQLTAQQASLGLTGTFTSAQFALQMLEMVPRVRFGYPPPEVEIAYS